LTIVLRQFREIYRIRDSSITIILIEFSKNQFRLEFYLLVSLVLSNKTKIKIQYILNKYAFIRIVKAIKFIKLSRLT